MIDVVKCPYCNYEHQGDEFFESDYYDFPCDDVSTDDVICDGCGQKFQVSIHVSMDVSFTVKELPDGKKEPEFVDPKQEQLFKEN